MRDEISAPKFVGVGRSASSDPNLAVAEALAGIDLHATCFVLAFIPAHFCAHRAAAALQGAARGTPVFGCTTAGQISGRGYETHALVLLAFSKENFRCASVLLEPLRPFNATEIAAQARQFSKRFRPTAGWNRLGLILSDGLCKQEDFLVSTLEAILHDLPIFGGSAGDGLRFDATFVLHNGQAHSNAAVLLLLETRLSFQGLGFDHFLSKDDPMVITKADQDERLVYEINGTPAAIEYARLVGCSVEALSPQVFAENPLLLEHNQRHYVRAISDTTDDQALAFLAAIEEGLVMTLGRGREILATLAAGLDLSAKSAGPPDFILGFDCVLRKLEIEQKRLDTAVSRILRQNRVFGFSTYGEQQSGVHMNQTFVGVAFFEPAQTTYFG
ncbi:MAG: FIST N-terminal domain-containing protein [Pseudomonadota bacterium]